MSTESSTTELAVIVLPEAVQALVRSSGLPENETTALARGFGQFFTQLEEVKKEIDAINEDDPTPEDEAKAREIRLKIKKVRTSSKNYKDEANEHIIREQKFNVAVYGIVEGETKPLEERLSKIEKASEIKETLRLDNLETERKLALEPFNVDLEFVDVRTMTDEKWLRYFESQKSAFDALEEKRQKDAELDERFKLREIRLTEYAIFPSEIEGDLRLIEDQSLERQIESILHERQAKIEAQKEMDRLAEEERLAAIESERLAAIEREKEAQRIREENERLRLEAEAKEKELHAEREAAEKLRIESEQKAEAERQKLIAEQKAETDRLAAIQKEKDERASAEKAALEAELLAKQKLEDDRIAAENLRIANEAEAAEKAAQAPDKEKLQKVAEYLLAINYPSCTSSKGKKAVEYVTERLDKLTADITAMIAKM